MSTQPALPRDCTTIHGLESDQPLWFTLAAEAVTEQHWRETPPTLLEYLPKLRKAAESYVFLSGMVGAILAIEGAEGAVATLVEVSVETNDNDEESPN